MPPKKSTETKATAKGQAVERTGTPKIVRKKEANNNDKDEPDVKPRSGRETKPAIKMESADGSSGVTATEGIPEAESPKRGPARAEKLNADVQILNTEGVKEISQASKKTGGWVYTGEEGVTPEESRVVGKDENGKARFPWAPIITMKKYVPSSPSYPSCSLTSKSSVVSPSSTITTSTAQRTSSSPAEGSPSSGRNLAC